MIHFTAAKDVVRNNVAETRCANQNCAMSLPPHLAAQRAVPVTAASSSSTSSKDTGLIQDSQDRPEADVCIAHNTFNQALTDPTRWGWSAAQGVVDVQVPHQVIQINVFEGVSMSYPRDWGIC